MNLKKLLLTLAALSGLFIAQNASATCSNYTTYADGQVLTASSLNSLQTNYTNCVNAVLDGDTFTGNMLWHSGNDILMYSDTGTTLKAAIYGDGAPAIIANTDAGTTNNCEFAVSGSTLTISGYGGVALSATNPCIVTVRQTTGKAKPVYFTANVSFTFGSSSNTDGNLWGLTEVDWGSAMPFFLGVIYDDTTPYFTISRLPYSTSDSASTGLCQKDDADCDAQKDVMILTTGLTLASWTSKPITQVGWFQMTYATSGNAWTASTSSSTGFNKEYESVTWTMPVSQNGAASGSYLLTNGGTAPVFTTSVAQYTISSSGMVEYVYFFTGDGGTDGAGAGADAVLAPPYFAVGSNRYKYWGAGFVQWPSGSQFIGAQYNDSLDGVFFKKNTAATTVANIKLGDFSNGSRELSGTIIYQAF